MCRPALVRGEEGQQNFNQPTASSGCFSFPGGDGKVFFFSSRGPLSCQNSEIVVPVFRMKEKIGGGF